VDVANNDFASRAAIGYIAPMKYSLRSLMTFSIRDLYLVTAIVAVCVAWWLDRSSKAQVIESQNVELQSMRLNEEVARAVAAAERAAAEAIAAAEESAIHPSLPSSAPATNMPKR
jgi:hypothetical protein